MTKIQNMNLKNIANGTAASMLGLGLYVMVAATPIQLNEPKIVLEQYELAEKIRSFNTCSTPGNIKSNLASHVKDLSSVIERYEAIIHNPEIPQYFSNAAQVRNETRPIGLVGTLMALTSISALFYSTCRGKNE